MKYDILIIGGGPGGYVAAIKAGQEGLSVCLIEENKVGGTCLNEGCIPTKTLIKSADTLDLIRNSGTFAIDGVDASAIHIDMQKLQQRKNQVISGLQGGIRTLLKRAKVTLVEGKASFVGPKTVKVGETTYEGENVIIATGSYAGIPRFIECTDDAKIITSRELLNITEVPGSIVIVGGGVIGIEFASILNSFGSEVTVLEGMPEILPMVDEELGVLVHKDLKKKGIKIHTGAMVSKISGNTVSFKVKEEEMSVSADVVLISIGRTPNTEGLGLENTGVITEKGAVVTDEHLRTNVPGIYAIGDVNGKYMLAHVASHEGIVAVENILGKDKIMNYGSVPSCIYIMPEIASVGMTEKEARDSHKDVGVGKFPVMANGKSLVEGNKTGIIKVIADKVTGEILGIHLYCPHATEMIGGLAALKSSEVITHEVVEAIFPHPSVSESVGEAFMAALGKAIHA